ncbi:MAG: glutaredoxin [Oscillospiraceae bacterium]|nr:glutaredoxin [Oscillospiraceae bacterium]
MMDELFAKSPEYRALEIETIDEIQQPDISDNYDYDLVPAYFVEDTLLYSGVPSLEIIKGVFDTAIS